MMDHREIKIVRIPTKMTGPITSAIINKHRLKIYPTDVGELTGKEIEERTGTPVWKILQRYNKFGQIEGIFSNKKLQIEKEAWKGVRKAQNLGFKSGEKELVSKLSNKSRHHKLADIKIGTWEQEN